jgi:hypothetical protein
MSFSETVFFLSAKRSFSEAVYHATILCLSAKRSFSATVFSPSAQRSILGDYWVITG